MNEHVIRFIRQSSTKYEYVINRMIQTNGQYMQLSQQPKSYDTIQPDVEGRQENKIVNHTKLSLLAKPTIVGKSPNAANSGESGKLPIAPQAYR